MREEAVKMGIKSPI